MKSNRVFLFENFSNYERSFPIRRTPITAEHLFSLYKLPYYVLEDSLLDTAKRVMNPPEDIISKQPRKLVRYITAPAGYGKKASVLPIFLRSGLTHYVYITFANSKDQHSQLVSKHLISDDPDIAAKQGAAFLFQCIKCRFESSSSGPHEIQLDPYPSSEMESLESLRRIKWAKKADAYFMSTSIVKCAHVLMLLVLEKTFFAVHCSFWPN